MKNRVCALVAEKKIYLLLLLVCSTVMMFADGLTATLQRGETMTAYFGQSALTEAYEAAADGDVITLSPGGFNPVTEIKKSVRIVGAYGLSDSDPSATYLNAAFTINADNVKLEGISFQNTVTLGTIKNCTIKRCWIINLYQSGTHTNTLIDQCVLMHDYAVETGVNYGIKNTTIDYFAAMNTTANVANVTNCVIWELCKHNQGSSMKQPYAVYKNCVLGLNLCYNNDGRVVFTSPSEFYNNYFFKINSYSTNTSYNIYDYAYSFSSGCINIGNTASRDKGTATKGNSNTSTYYNITYPCSYGPVKGEDNTPVGITGGEGFNAYPGIPRVLTSAIDAQTDDKGKLNASITVKAEK